ncbi:MAG: arginine--tRNA ligase [Patescibacteria group bacterium]|nr:arginine--tRNA ligase [Patescibacteria group bacterium]
MIREKISKLIKNSIKELQMARKLPKFDIPEIQIEHPEEKTHGDYATNLAMIIAKEIKKDSLEIAKLINNQLLIINKNLKLFEKIEVKNPGFINFFLSKEFLIKELEEILRKKEKYGSGQEKERKTIVIDYSSPNIAKPFGIGHLRSTIIGQAIYNIYKFLGWRCIGDNHLGDWGTQFGKLIYQIKEKKLKGKTQRERKKILKSLTLEELERLYVEFHKRAQFEPELEEEARKWFKKLEKGDKEAKEIWQILKDISLKEFKRIYQLLGVKFDYCLGESFYEDKLKEVIKEVIKKKIALESKGALIIKFPKDILPPAMVLKSDKTSTYFTRDLATIKYRLKRWKPDLIVYEVGADQILHFKQLFWAAELLGWAKREKFFHVAHGLIRWKGGKFSTRRGKTIHLEEVLKEAIKRAENIIEKSKTGRGLSEKEKQKVAKAVGIGAVKYNDLSQHYSSDIIFDWQKILNLKGNSGPYLQYTFARCKSVLKKANFKKRVKITYRDFNKEEMEILHQIYKFPEIIEESAKRFSPNLICDFIFDLAKNYNLFYNLHPIIRAENSEQKLFRLSLTQAVSQILKKALDLLGILVPERM